MSRIWFCAVFVLVSVGPSGFALAQDSPSSAASTAARTTADEKGKTDALLKDYSVQVGQPKTLAELLDMAAAQAPDILRARKRIGLGEAAIEGAEKFQPYNPEIEGEFGIGLEDFGLAKTEITLKQRLEIFGQRGMRIEAAQQRQQALQAELAQADWDVHQEVHGLYRLGLVDQKRIEVERDILDFTQELFGITQQRFEAGEEPRTSVIVAKAEIAQARQRLVHRWVNYIQTLRDLGTALGWTAEKPPQPTGEIAPTRPIPERADLLKRAFKKDPQLVVLQARLAQAKAEVALQQRDVWPDPVVGIGWERENLATNEVENKLRLIVGIPLPIWNRNQGEIGASQAQTQVVRQAIDNRKNTLKNVVLKQADAVEAASKQAQIFEQEVLPALGTQLELLQEGFRLGELSLLDVMNARDRLLAGQREYLDALQTYYLAISELENLLGTSIWNME